MVKILTLKEASKLTGYHQDYLSALVRSGKLKAERAGRSWLVTEDDLRVFAAEKNLLAPVATAADAAPVKRRIGLYLIFIILAVAVMATAIIYVFSLAFANRPAAGQPTEEKHEQEDIVGVKIKTYYTEDAAEFSAQPQ